MVYKEWVCLLYQMFVSVIVPMELSSLVSLACETLNLSTKKKNKLQIRHISQNFGDVWYQLSSRLLFLAVMNFHQLLPATYLVTSTLHGGYLTGLLWTSVCSLPSVEVAEDNSMLASIKKWACNDNLVPYEWLHLNEHYSSISIKWINKGGQN